MTFKEWWKKLKPAECDELKEYFEQAYTEGRESMQEEAAKRVERLVISALTPKGVAHEIRSIKA